jgi:hypothetical protein
MRALFLACLVLAAFGGAAAAAPGDAIDVTDNDALIQFRPVVDCAANPGAPHLSIYSTQAHCLAAPVLTEKDFVRLQRLNLGGPPILRAQLTQEAQLKYFTATRDHRFRPMALIVQGRPTRVWDVRGPARPVWLIVSGGYLTDMHANEVADRYYAQGGRG